MLTIKYESNVHERYIVMVSDGFGQLMSQTIGKALITHE